MNLASIIILLVVAALAFWAIRTLRRKGTCNCGSCPQSCNCNKKDCNARN
ncbi:MAG: FeoB-associated Cys-rich membrane protein [Bacteroidales bacterium]|nr:FeoB-associated Cys-rich membrane protein [Bacteroidales bacterium]